MAAKKKKATKAKAAKPSPVKVAAALEKDLMSTHNNLLSILDKGVSSATRELGAGRKKVVTLSKRKKSLAQRVKSNKAKDAKKSSAASRKLIAQLKEDQAKAASDLAAQRARNAVVSAELSELKGSQKRVKAIDKAIDKALKVLAKPVRRKKKKVTKKAAD